MLEANGAQDGNRGKEVQEMDQAREDGNKQRGMEEKGTIQERQEVQERLVQGQGQGQGQEVEDAIVIMDEVEEEKRRKAVDGGRSRQG